VTLGDAISALSNAGIESARYDARELFHCIGGIDKSALLSLGASCDKPELLNAIERRCKREPLQYIIGEVSFYRESYEVSPDCLIPRADTEILVDFAVKEIPEGKRFLDLCTGSGCVAISTLKNTSSTSAVAVDISDAALSVARRNAEKNGVSDRIEFKTADVMKETVTGEFFAILSNPPYVTESAYKGLEPEIYFEPEIAFVGGESGLVFYEKILDSYRNRIDPSGFFAFEIGFDQASALAELAATYAMKCEIIKDYSGNDRVAVLKMA